MSQDNLQPGVPEHDAEQEEPLMDPQQAAFAEDSELGLMAGDETASVDDPGQDLQSQLQEVNDRLLRSQAELDNYRKRARREMDDQLKYAQLPIIRDLLPVLDNLERAIAATNQAEGPAVENLLQGVQLVTDELKSVLQRHHCCQIVAQGGMEFDPNCHEAISQQPSADHPAGTVMYVAQTGYQLHDRVVRPSQVVVAMVNPEEGDSEASSKESSEG